MKVREKNPDIKKKIQIFKEKTILNSSMNNLHILKQPASLKSKYGSGIMLFYEGFKIQVNANKKIILFMYKKSMAYINRYFTQPFQAIFPYNLFRYNKRYSFYTDYLMNPCHF